MCEHVSICNETGKKKKRIAEVRKIVFSDLWISGATL
jgi:hypothetical protein